MTKNTPVDAARFAELYMDTTNTKYDIAEALGIQPDSVYRIAKRHGLPSRPLTPPREQGANAQRFRQMWMDGASNEEIAAELGVLPSSVGKIRHRLGLPLRPRNSLIHSPDLAEQVAAKMAEGKNRVQIADELGVKVDMVTRIRRRLGLPRFPVVTPRYVHEKRVDRDVVVRMSKEGMTVARIAQAVGCSEETVSRIRKEFGVARRAPVAYPEEIRQQAKAMLEDGASYNEIERTLGVPSRRVSKWFPGMGWTQAQAVQYRHLKRQMEELDGRMRTGLDWV